MRGEGAPEEMDGQTTKRPDDQTGDRRRWAGADKRRNKPLSVHTHAHSHTRVQVSVPMRRHVLDQRKVPRYPVAKIPRAAVMATESGDELAPLAGTSSGTSGYRDQSQCHCSLPYLPTRQVLSCKSVCQLRARALSWILIRSV